MGPLAWRIASLFTNPDAQQALERYNISMSRAFIKEADEGAAFEELPERLVSPHPNLVTEHGLELIEAEVDRLSREYAAAHEQGERAAIAAIARDLRYWTARRASAEVVPASDKHEVRFGTSVTIEREDGRKQTYRIVGEDEADPAHGTVSYVSPLARALMGKSVGDVVRVSSGDAEVIAIA